MNEHDRMLAEGPRVAPEPRMISDDGTADVVPAMPEEPAEPVARPDDRRRQSGDAVRAGRPPRPWYFRAIPAAVIGLAAIGRLLGSRSWAADLISVVWVAALLLFIARRRKR
jgi:hypothetical protein